MLSLIDFAVLKASLNLSSFNLTHLTMKKYVVELIGTFFLVLVIGLTGNPIAIGSILMVMVYMGGTISGAHYNPAITLAVLMRKKIESKDAGMYMIFQVLGTVLASLLVYMVKGETFAPAPGDEVEIVSALLIEAVFTFALALVVLNVATTKAAAGNSYFGLAIGFTVLAAAFAGGGISGGAYNPAVGLGPCLIDTLIGGNNSLAYVWLYIVGPFGGAALATTVFNYTNPNEK
jgi:aquaporin Z